MLPESSGSSSNTKFRAPDKKQPHNSSKIPVDRIMHAMEATENKDGCTEPHMVTRHRRGY